MPFDDDDDDSAVAVVFFAQEHQPQSWPQSLSWNDFVHVWWTLSLARGDVTC